MTSRRFMRPISITVLPRDGLIIAPRVRPVPVCPRLPGGKFGRTLLSFYNVAGGLHACRSHGARCGVHPGSPQTHIDGRCSMKTATRFAVVISTAMLSTAAFLGAQAQQPPPQSPDMTFFVVGAGPGKGADLGGIEGADRYCQELAQRAGAGAKTWRAYLSTQAAEGKPAVDARDRIGRGPWQNFKGEIVAQNVDDLHSDNNKLSTQTSLTERRAI